MPLAPLAFLVCFVSIAIGFLCFVSFLVARNKEKRFSAEILGSYNRPAVPEDFFSCLAFCGERNVSTLFLRLRNNGNMCFLLRRETDISAQYSFQAVWFCCVSRMLLETFVSQSVKNNHGCSLLRCGTFARLSSCVPYAPLRAQETPASQCPLYALEIVG